MCVLKQCISVANWTCIFTNLGYAKTSNLTGSSWIGVDCDQHGTAQEASSTEFCVMPTHKKNRPVKPAPNTRKLLDLVVSMFCSTTMNNYDYVM